MIRASRAARIRGLGQPLTFTAQTCPPGYHWETPTVGPIQGVRRMGAMSACVKDKALAFHLGPPPLPPPPRRVVINIPTRAPSLPAAPPVVVRAPPAVAVRTAIPMRADAPPVDTTEPTPEACATCWPWWWLLVAAGAGAAAAGVARASGKKKKGEGARRMNPYVARIVNAGTHHVIRAVMR